MRFLQRQLVGDVVPDQRRGIEFNRMIECRKRFVLLPEIQIGITKADLQLAAVGSQGSSFFQLGNGEVILVPLGVHRAQVGMRKLVERIVLELLVEGFRCLVVLAVLPVRAAEIVVCEFVVRIDFDLFLERGDRLIVLAHLQVDETEIVPCEFVLGIDFSRALQEHFGYCQIAGVDGSARAFKKIIGLHVGRRDEAARDRAFNRQLLRQVGAHSSAEGFVVRGAGDRQIVLMQR